MWLSRSFTVLAFLCLLSTEARAQPSESSESPWKLEARLDAAALARKNARIGILPRLGLGVEVGRRAALIVGGSVGALVGSDGSPQLVVSPYAGARFHFDRRFAVDVTLNYHQFVGLDDKLEPIPGGVRSHDTLGFGGTVGGAFAIPVSRLFWLRAHAEAGVATFDDDKFFPGSEKIVEGYRGGFLFLGGIGVGGRLPL